MDRIPTGELEERLLGKMVLCSDLTAQALSVLGSRADRLFEISAHRDLFRTVVELNEEEIPSDLVSVRDRLRDRHLLERVGGDNYLIDLVQSSHPSEDIVRDAEMLRKRGRGI